MGTIYGPPEIDECAAHRERQALDELREQDDPDRPRGCVAVMETAAVIIGGFFLAVGAWFLVALVFSLERI